MAKKDLYEILGISRDATKKEIVSAYRKMAMKYHPDRNQGDEKAVNKFKEATEAFEVLSDRDKKSQYDQFGSIGEDGFGGGGNMNMDSAMNIFEHLFQNMSFGGGFDGFRMGGNDFFSGFGRRRQRSRRVNGGDIQKEVSLTLKEVAVGDVKREVEIKIMGECPNCHGTRLAEDGEMTKCPGCNGTGERREVNRAGFAHIVNIIPCSDCRGEGEIIEGKCPACRGEGRKEVEKKISIEIPAGLSDGSRLVLRGKGHAGMRGGKPGDLFVFMKVREHPFFNRDGDDILVEVPITLGQALKGDTVEIPGLLEKHKIKIKSGTEPNTIVTLKGKGVPHLQRRGRGDMHIRLFYLMPKKLTGAQKKLAKEWWATEKKQRNAIVKLLGKKGK